MTDLQEVLVTQATRWPKFYSNLIPGASKRVLFSEESSKQSLEKFFSRVPHDLVKRSAVCLVSAATTSRTRGITTVLVPQRKNVYRYLNVNDVGFMHRERNSSLI